MAGFNGSGVFVLNYNWETEAGSPPIEISKLQTEMEELKGGLDNVICRDGQSTISANIPFNDKRITGLADASADTDALNRQTADARFEAISETKIKTADETVNNSDTLQDDNHLTGFAIAAATYYWFNGLLIVDDVSSCGFKIDLPFTQTPQLSYCVIRRSFNGSGDPSLDTSLASGDETLGFASGGSGINLFKIEGVVLGHASSAGTVKLQWAQNSATAKDTDMKKGSFMRFVPIS